MTPYRLRRRNLPQDSNKVSSTPVGRTDGVIVIKRGRFTPYSEKDPAAVAKAAVAPVAASSETPRPDAAAQAATQAVDSNRAASEKARAKAKAMKQKQN